MVLRVFFNCGGQAQEVSEEKNVSIDLETVLVIFLVKNVTAFCPCPKSLPVAKMKSFELIPLAEELSKDSYIDLE